MGLKAVLERIERFYAEKTHDIVRRVKRVAY